RLRDQTLRPSFELLSDHAGADLRVNRNGSTGSREPGQVFDESPPRCFFGMVARMFRPTRSFGLVAVSALVASLAVAPSLAPAPAEGQARNSAQIYIVQGRVPSSLPGKDGIVKFGRKNHRNTLQEVTGVPVKDRSW